MQIGKSYISDLEVSPVVLKAIADISSGTPRIMKSFMLSLQAWCIANEYNKVEFGHFVKFLIWLDIDKYGMTINDRQYIRTIFMNGNAPLGIQKLCKLSYITQDDVEQVIEPKLIEKGFVTFTAKGRSLSNAGLIYARENIR
jgi:Holliday junction resolvasome RuvABC ATP-dependent DNA helicase subunit